jgi:Reverse transcriptase (RNA-dependent DNA polymerase)
MAIPNGYPEYMKEKHNIDVYPKTQCLKLTKAIYGLVQAARQWWKLGFKPSRADPCLFIKNQDGCKKTYLIIYVDYGGIFTDEEEIIPIITALSKVIVVKDLGPIDTFVGCKIIENKEKDTISIHQPQLIKDLEEQFGPLVAGMRTYITPAAPSTNIQHPEKVEIIISLEDQTEFRSGVGMILYLVKHSRPDLANPVQELSKVSDRATKDHCYKLLRAIKFVLDTKYLGLKMEPEWDEPIKMVNGKPDWASIFQTKCTMGATSDSKYSGDKETQQSVFEWELYFMQELIAHKSKANAEVLHCHSLKQILCTIRSDKGSHICKAMFRYYGNWIEYTIKFQLDIFICLCDLPSTIKWDKTTKLPLRRLVYCYLD